MEEKTFCIAVYLETKSFKSIQENTAKASISITVPVHSKLAAGYRNLKKLNH